MIGRTLRTLFGAGMLCLVVLGAGVGYDLYRDLTFARRERERQMQELRERVAQQRERMRQLGQMVERLTSERRVAVCQVVSQQPNPVHEIDSSQPTLITELLFQEVDENGEPIPERPGKRVKVLGDIVYVDALVIQFEENLVAAGDETRGKSACLFRRIFGEHQRPSDGFPLDEPGAVPTAYRPDGQLDPFIAELWRDFWKIANDPDAYAPRGIKVMHGQAPYFKAKYGNAYTLQIEADGGLNIRVARMF